MLRTSLFLVALALLAACGDEQAAAPEPKSSAAPPAAVSSAPAPGPATMPPALDAEEELVYDPIDVSKLNNSWWKQYSAGS